VCSTSAARTMPAALSRTAALSALSERRAHSIAHLRLLGKNRLRFRRTQYAVDLRSCRLPIEGTAVELIDNTLYARAMIGAQRIERCRLGIAANLLHLRAHLSWRAFVLSVDSTAGR